MYQNEPILIDEIHTPDSSRFFYADSYQELQDKGLPQKQLSKEFVREWLIENDFQGLEGQSIPPMSDGWVQSISERYQELYEVMTGSKLIPRDYQNIIVEMEKAISVGITKS